MSTPTVKFFAEKITYISTIHRNPSKLDVTLLLPYPDFQNILQHHHFNLTPEIQQPLPNLPNPSSDVTLTLRLKPSLLSHLPEDLNDGESFRSYLQELEQQRHLDPAPPALALLHSESWFCLTIQQPDNETPIRHRTFWDYVNPGDLETESQDPERIKQSVAQFLQDFTQSQVSHLFEDLGDKLGSALESFLQEASSQKNSSNPSQPMNGMTGLFQPKPTLLETVIQFLLDDDWSFEKMKGATALQFGFSGENGEWTCLAQAKEDQNQFIFYSRAPVEAPEDKRLAMAEFLTRANYNLILGNFEMDFSDGEIRYKTSIDVEGDRLTPALIKPIIYSNLQMMDKYLPGITSVIEGSESPEAAVNRIDNPPSD